MAIKLAIPHNWFLSRCKSFASQFIRNMLFFCDIVFSTFSAIEYFAVKNILVIQNSVKNHICRKSNAMVPQIHKRSSKDLIQV